jgi:hypothetical protein
MEKLVARVCFNSTSSIAKLQYEVDILHRTHEEQAGGGGEYADHLPRGARSGLDQGRLAPAKYVRTPYLSGCSVLCEHSSSSSSQESRVLGMSDCVEKMAHASSAHMKALAKSEYQAGKDRCHCERR